MTRQPKPAVPEDGRKARSQRTRAAIAKAMLDCLEAGRLRPSAEDVAERAGVSARAVFRHFDTLEALLHEVATQHVERVTRQLRPVLVDGSLEERIDALVSNTARVHEIIAPVRRAALLVEPFSEVVRERHNWFRGIARRQIRSAFAPEFNRLSEARRRDRVASICALLSFSYWEELRRHENLSEATATAVLRDVLEERIRSD
jgi:AcrR family transcriptional regulator